MTAPASRLALAARALAMTDSRAAEILTWTDEPELIQRPGEPVPTFHPADVAAARLRGAWSAAALLNTPAGLAGARAQAARYPESMK